MWGILKTWPDTKDPCSRFPSISFPCTFFFCNHIDFPVFPRFISRLIYRSLIFSPQFSLPKEYRTTTIAFVGCPRFSRRHLLIDVRASRWRPCSRCLLVSNPGTSARKLCKFDWIPAARASENGQVPSFGVGPSWEIRVFSLSLFCFPMKVGGYRAQSLAFQSRHSRSQLVHLELEEKHTHPEILNKSRN